MFTSIFVFESKRLFIRRNIIILVIIFFLSAFFCLDGISDYKIIQSNKKPFQEMERDKVSLHIHYTFYGIRGVRLLFVPSPLSVIFNDLAVFEGMTAHVDTAEKLNISNSFKGKGLFSNSGGYMDFSGIMLLIGSFLSLLYGYDVTRSRGYLKMIADLSCCRGPAIFLVLARLILINLTAWVLSGLTLLWLLVNGIPAGNVFYLYFVLVLTLVITFFLLTGALIGSINQTPARVIALPVVYFLLVLFVPWLVQKAVYVNVKKDIQSIYQFEYDTFKYVMEFEKRLYERFGVWKSGEPASDEIKAAVQSGQEIEYKKVREAELKRINDLEKEIRNYHSLTALFPTTFYLSTNKELSSKGYRNFIAFVRYAYKKKQEFIKFYIDRKFHQPLPETGVEPFIKNNEDLFYGQSLLPPSFKMGTALTFLYILVFLFGLYKLDTGQTKPEPQIPQIAFDKKENALLVLCENDRVKDDIFRFFQGRENTSCLDKIPVDFRSDGLRVITVLRHFAQLAGADPNPAALNLAMLGINNLDAVNLSRDHLLKIYAAVKLAGEPEHVLFNEFFKNESRELENDFLALFSHLESQGIRVLYLCREMPNPKNPLDEKIRVRNFATFPLQFDRVTLR